MAGKAGEYLGWYNRVYPEAGCFMWTSRCSKGEISEDDMSVNSVIMVSMLEG